MIFYCALKEEKCKLAYRILAVSVLYLRSIGTILCTVMVVLCNDCYTVPSVPQWNLSIPDTPRDKSKCGVASIINFKKCSFINVNTQVVFGTYPMVEIEGFHWCPHFRGLGFHCIQRCPHFSGLK